jgi:hypothetical protein
MLSSLLLGISKKLDNLKHLVVMHFALFIAFVEVYGLRLSWQLELQIMCG